MNMNFSRIASMLAVVVLLCMPGCSNDPNALKGYATVDGLPIEKGVLIFTPDADKGNTGRRALCDIVDGKFYVTPITPGPNIVKVSVHKKPANGELLTIQEFKEFKMYTVDVVLPEPGSKKFKIDVSSTESNRTNESDQNAGNEEDSTRQGDEGSAEEADGDEADETGGE
jgi:hypothetical protein